MPKADELIQRDAHFDFGKNWADYSALIDDEKLDAAVKALRDFLPDLAGKSFLDIGSGSGLSAAAALRLGVERVHAIDIDEDSVRTTRNVLSRLAPGGRWVAEKKSAFDLSPERAGQFDVVYSWGVLHHTGDMWRAIERAAAMVAPSGTLAIALYEKSPLCGVWRVEKRFYMRAAPGVQSLIRGLYRLSFGAARLIATGGRRRKYGKRGMTSEHDLHDWLGGYPYESTNADELRGRLEALGFEPIAERPVKVHLAGLFGTGCSEFAYRKVQGS